MAVPERVRRGSVHPDYLAVQLQSLRLDDEPESEEAAAKASPKFKGGKFTAENDRTLHALPRDVLACAAKVKSIVVTGCPIRYLGTNLETSSVEDDLSIQRSLSISPFFRLTELRVTHAKLTCMPAGFDGLPELKIVDLSHNCISSLSPDVASGRRIQVLDVSYNLLNTELPCDIVYSPSLQVLKLQNNDLTAAHFPEGVDFDDAVISLRELHIDAQVMDGLGRDAPYPMANLDGLTVLPKAEHVPTLKRQQQSSRFALVPPKGDEARDVQFHAQALVWYRWEDLGPDEDYQYTDEFKVQPTEFVVKSYDHLYSLWDASRRDAEDQIIGPICKVSHVLIEGDHEAERMLPLLELAPAVRVVVFKNCNISVIPDDFFDRKHSLKYVDFRGNNIREIPPSFSRSTSLRIALFDDNFIFGFPVVPVNLVYLSLNGNCLCIDNDPSDPRNTISTDRFALARALKRLEMKDNTALVEDIFPRYAKLPAHLRLKMLVLDRKAVKSTVQSDRPFLMEDGREPTYVEVADSARHERLMAQRFIDPFKRTVIGRRRFAERFTPATE